MERTGCAFGVAMPFYEEDAVWFGEGGGVLFLLVFYYELSDLVIELVYHYLEVTGFSFDWIYLVFVNCVDFCFLKVKILVYFIEFISLILFLVVLLHF